MFKNRILIVEDHEVIRTSVAEELTKAGFLVEQCDNLLRAEQMLVNNRQFDLLILDWNLPDGQGIDLLKKLRMSGQQIPILFLTARADIFDKVLALELGSNDYLTKPFDVRELIARVRARLRDGNRSEVNGDVNLNRLQINDLMIDRTEHKVLFKGRKIELVKKEFDLLFLLASYPDKVFSRDELLNKVWGFEHFPTTRTVDTHILQLRQKLSDDLIETIRAVGYRLKKA